MLLGEVIGVKNKTYQWLHCNIVSPELQKKVQGQHSYNYYYLECNVYVLDRINSSEMWKELMSSTMHGLPS